MRLRLAVQCDACVRRACVNNGLYGTIRMPRSASILAQSSAPDLRNPDFAAYARFRRARREPSSAPKTSPRPTSAAGGLREARDHRASKIDPERHRASRPPSLRDCDEGGAQVPALRKGDELRVVLVRALELEELVVVAARGCPGYARHTAGRDTETVQRRFSWSKSHARRFETRGPCGGVAGALSPPGRIW